MAWIWLPEGLSKLAGWSALDARRRKPNGTQVREAFGNNADGVLRTANFETKSMTSYDDPTSHHLQKPLTTQNPLLTVVLQK